MSLMVGGHTWWGGGGSGGGTGKTAVQLLQESKSQYVKSDVVLGTSQHLARPDRFHISSNPNIFLNAPAHTLHASRLSPDPPRRAPAAEQPQNNAPTQVTVATLTSSSLAEHTNSINKIHGVTPQPVRIQRGAPRPRAKTQPIGDAFFRGGDLRRSLSHGPADRGGVNSGNDIQMKLRRLLDVGSKEKLCPDSPVKVPLERSITNGEICTGTGTFRAEPAKVTVHKSLPDLWKTIAVGTSTENNIEQISNEIDQRRPSCPSAISTERERNHKPKIKTISAISTERERSRKPKIKTKPTVTPPPVPPRKSKENLRPLPQPPKEAPELPERVAPRPPPPRLPPRSKIQCPVEVRNSIEPTPIDGARRASGSDASITAATEDIRRKPILRSKSDVTHERCALVQKEDDEDHSLQATINSEDLEKFFESMGLDVNTYQEIMSPADEGSALYFDEKSSEDSIPRRCSSGEETQQQQAGLRAGEPSIVEKNARIIKWLFICQRAQGNLPQRPSTKSS